MNSQVKQILAILSTAVLGGFLLAFFFIWSYGPTGQYKAEHAILSPDMMNKISIKEANPTSGKEIKFVYDKTTFVHFDILLGTWQQNNVPLKPYEEFYSYIKNDKSALDPEEGVLNLFQRPNPTTLVTFVKAETFPAAKAFQVIQFTKEDYYRVKLQGQGEENQWANFYHQGIYKKAMSLFGSTRQ